MRSSEDTLQQDARMLSSFDARSFTAALPGPHNAATSRLAGMQCIEETSKV